MVVVRCLSFIAILPFIADYSFNIMCSGADPNQVANEILTNVANGQSDFVVAATFSAKAALWLKFLAPGFLEKQLVKRFEKGQLEMKKES